MKELRNYFLIPLAISVVLSISACCNTQEPPKVEPAKEFQSLQAIEKSEPAPEDGWFMNDKDWEDLLDILLEVERGSSDSD